MNSDPMPAIQKSERMEWYPGRVVIDLKVNDPWISVPGDDMLLVVIDDMPAKPPIAIEMMYRAATKHGPKDRMLMDYLADGALEVDAAIMTMMGA